MSFRTVCFLGLVLAWLASPTAARAHDIQEMTINARVFADRIELAVVVSNHLAVVLLTEPDGNPVTLDAETFPALRPRLEAQGKQLCALRAGDDAAAEIAPDVLDVVRGEQDEVEFFLTYPAAKGDVLRISAPVLERLEEGYAVTLKVLDAKRKMLGAGVMSRGRSSLAVPLAGGATETTPK